MDVLQGILAVDAGVYLSIPAPMGQEASFRPENPQTQRDKTESNDQRYQWFIHNTLNLSPGLYSTSRELQYPYYNISCA
jgi:hypothetical protein